MFSFTEIFRELIEKLFSWIKTGVVMAPNAVVAILVVVIFSISSRYVRRITLTLLHRVSDNEAVNNLIATILRLSILLIGIFVALTIVELDGTVTTLLAGVGVIGLALGFAFQDLAANFIAGIFMAVRKPFKIGDIIESNDFMGVVRDITLRSTEIQTFQGQRIVLPNKSIFENPIQNFSTGSRRIDLAVGVSYGDDLQRVEDLTLNVVRSLPDAVSRKPVELYYDSYGDSSINFTVCFWIDFKKQPDFLRARSEAIKAIKEAYDREGITIPFPIRTLDFGIKGGEPLNTMLNSRQS